MMIPRRYLSKFVLRLYWLWHFFITFFPITTSAIFSWTPHVHFWWRNLKLRGFRKQWFHHFHLTLFDYLNAMGGSRYYLIFFIIIVSSDWLESSSLSIQDIMSVKNFRRENLFMLHATLRLAHRRMAFLVLWISWYRWVIENLMNRIPLFNRDTTAAMFVLILRRLQNRALTHSEWSHLVIIDRILLAIVATPKAKFVHDLIEPCVNGSVKHIKVVSELLKFLSMMFSNQSEGGLLLF